MNSGTYFKTIHQQVYQLILTLWTFKDFFINIYLCQINYKLRLCLGLQEAEDLIIFFRTHSKAFKASSCDCFLFHLRVLTNIFHISEKYLF